MWVGPAHEWNSIGHVPNTGPPLCMQPQSQVLSYGCWYTPTVCSKCLQVFVTVVFSIDSILSVTVSAIDSPIGHFLLEVPSSTVRVVGKVRPTPTLAVGSADPEGGVFGLTKLDPFPTYRGMCNTTLHYVLPVKVSNITGSHTTSIHRVQYEMSYPIHYCMYCICCHISIYIFS